MADWTTGMTKAANVDDSQITLWNEGVILAAQEQLIMDPFASIKEEAQAKTFQFTKYTNLTAATTALTDGTDPDSEALADSAVTLTPAEYGNVVTRTKLAYLQTNGKVDSAAIKLAGFNMGQTLDKLAIQSLEASTNELTPNSVAEASLTVNDTISEALIESAYNKLRRTPVDPITGQFYVCVMHPDVASDFRSIVTAGSWVDVSKYSNAMAIFKNEIGFFKGFRIIENANVTINTDAGDGAVDTYHTLCFGSNALGKGVSEAPHLTVTGPFDKLGRFVNIGWYGVLKYGIIDQNSLWVVTTASSFGSNT